MRQSLFGYFAVVVVLLASAATALPCCAKPLAAVVCPGEPTAQEALAAREIRRYVYVRTGELLPLLEAEAPPAGVDSVVVAGKDRPIVAKLATEPALKRRIAELGPQQYVLATVPNGNGRVVLVVGGDGPGTLYGAYRLAEHLGVRFFLHGDVIPDKQIPWKLPKPDETGKPLFALRGVNPWGSHPFGFDQWSADDYKTHIGQLAKMRMNFIGMHCYPEGHPYAEPTVWLGLDGEFDDAGGVKVSYPSRYYNTLWRGVWGPMLPKPTGEYSFGGRLLFERDDWGPDVMLGHCPTPATPEACNEVFDRTGRQFRDAFTFARLVGVKTCIGTEAPMMMPAALQGRLKSQGKDPADPAVVQEVYEGIFRRIARTHPLDYYWLWTPEGWTWGGNTPAQMQATVTDVKLAAAALKKVGSPFKLATCGWVLGPKGDRAALDRMVPKEIAMSAISRVIGYEPVDPAYGEIRGRDRWAIPWLESDDLLADPQLWVARTRKDAADALAYGCTGLMGLQWRTRILGPNVAALAQAGWDQSPWNPSPGTLLPNVPPVPAETVGPLGGQTADYPGREIKNTEDDRLYQTCRYNLQGYRLKVPEGTYRVTLKFCEPHFSAAGQRVCDVKLQGKTVIEKLDIFAKVGQFAALDYSFDGVQVTGGGLQLDIIHRESLPCISAIVVESESQTKKINCGGAAYKDYAADVAPAASALRHRGVARGLPADDFYADWAAALFGPEAAGEVAGVFMRIDGRVPHSLGGGCPSGSLHPIARPWHEMAAPYAFVDELAALRPKVQGPGNRQRFDYWLGKFRYLRGQARVQCALGQFAEAMKKVGAEQDAARRKTLAAELALPAYREVVDRYGRMYAHLLSTVSTSGGFAEVINLEHGAKFWPVAIDGPGQQLAAALGGPLPEDARPPKEYSGPTYLIVPTVRTSVARGETLNLKVVVLSSQRPQAVTLHWREMGRGEFGRVRFTHVARGVYTVRFPPATAGMEYYVEAALPDGSTTRHPATAPDMNQTLVLLPAG